MPNEKISLAFR